jgi:hypothetical protein
LSAASTILFTVTAEIYSVSKAIESGVKAKKTLKDLPNGIN